ncbi:helix-turn-helix transcriptional regulator [Candidatus Poribacteria bacterium]|nr:helix-turn-helix transcriptional regulator [Candidatus Poribacteria bacterium]
MKNNKPRAIPNCLKKYRKIRGLRQKDVAKILGIKSASMVSRWEKGLCMPNTLNLFKLAILYRTIADALFIDVLRALRDDVHKAEEKVLNTSINLRSTNKQLRSGT